MTSTTVMSPREIEELLRAGRRSFAAKKGWARRRRNWDEYLSLHGHADVLMAFANIGYELDGPTYWRLFRDGWTRAEQFQPRQFWHMLLHRHPAERDAMMTAEERDFLAGLPSTVRVYRGAGSREHVQGFSWTLDCNRAHWFAQRFAENAEAASARLSHYDPNHLADPVVAHGTVRKAHIIAYLAERKESEIVVLPESVTIDRIEPIDGQSSLARQARQAGRD